MGSFGVRDATSVAITEDTLAADLSDGRTICVPLTWYPRLVHATMRKEQRADPPESCRPVSVLRRRPHPQGAATELEAGRRRCRHPLARPGRGSECRGFAGRASIGREPATLDIQVCPRRRPHPQGEEACELPYHALMSTSFVSLPNIDSLLAATALVHGTLPRRLRTAGARRLRRQQRPTHPLLQVCTPDPPRRPAPPQGHRLSLPQRRLQVEPHRSSPVQRDQQELGRPPAAQLAPHRSSSCM